MEHEREGTVLHAGADPQAHLVAVTGGVTGRAVLVLEATVDDGLAVVVHHFLVHVDAAGGKHDCLGALVVHVVAVGIGGDDAGDAAGLVLHELLGAGVEVIGRAHAVVLVGILGVDVQHGGGQEVARLLGEGHRVVHLVELVIREALGDDGVGGIGAERVGLDAVLCGLVDEPVASLAGLVEPQGDEGLLHAACAGADPAVLSLLDVDREVLANLLAIGLGELGVAQAHAAATALNGAELLDDDDVEAVVDAGAGGSAAGVAGTDDDDVGGLGGSAASRVDGLRGGHEGRHGLLIGRACSVNAASLGGGSILHILIGARATSKRSGSRPSSQSGNASTSKERTTREGHLESFHLISSPRATCRLAAGWPPAHHITQARRGHLRRCARAHVLHTLHPRAPCSRLASGTSHHSVSPGASCGVAWRLMYASTPHLHAPCS